MFKPIAGFQARLHGPLRATDAALRLSASDIAKIAAALTDETDYTRLWIGDAHRYEIVKVTGIVSGLPAIVRGEEGTAPQSFTAGECVAFVWTTQNLIDFIQQGMLGAQPAVCSVTAASDRVTVTNNDCAVAIDIPACSGESWRAGNFNYEQSDSGCLEKTPVDTPLVDGTYVNATLTVEGGYITAIRSGSNIVFTGGGCCNGGGDIPVEGPEGPQGPQGEPGAAGTTIQLGNYAPAGSANDGDLYIDTSTWELYQYDGGVWVAKGSIQGAQGAAGTNGTNGTDGTNGTQLSTGTGVPSAATGSEGDLYLDTSTGNLYQYTASGWQQIGSFMGPQGPQGEPGQNGADGSDGSDGAAAAPSWSVCAIGNVAYVVGPPNTDFTLTTEEEYSFSATTGEDGRWSGDTVGSDLLLQTPPVAIYISGAGATAVGLVVN